MREDFVRLGYNAASYKILLSDLSILDKEDITLHRNVGIQLPSDAAS